MARTQWDIRRKSKKNSTTPRIWVKIRIIRRKHHEFRRKKKKKEWVSEKGKKRQRERVNQVRNSEKKQSGSQLQPFLCVRNSKVGAKGMISGENGQQCA